jgi:peroxiredoxin
VAAFPEVKIEKDAVWPGFYLPDLEGKPLSVQDYRGKKIVLHIFASW